MSSRRALHCAGAMVAAIALASCSAAASGSDGSSSPGETDVVTITSLDVPAPEPAPAERSPDAPQRIVTLALGTGETVAALGVGGQVVGRDEASSAPGIDAAPVLTLAHEVSAERVLAVEPDLVIVDDATSPPEAVDQLRAAGIRVVTVPQAWSVDDIGARVRAIADAIGVPESAAEGVIAQSAGAVPAQPTGARVAFLYLRGTSAIYLLGGEGSGADDLIERAGGVDVGAELGLPAFTPLTAEALAEADPDVLLVMTEGLASVGGPDGLRQLPGVAQTAAGRAGRIIAVDDTLLLSFGPRTGALVDALSAALDRLTASSATAAP